MARLYTRIDTLYGMLQELLPMNPEFQQKLDKKIRLEFNYNSNHIEGNTLTYGETELLLIFGESTGNHTKQELDEMEGHDVAFEMIKKLAKSDEIITEADIKNLNKIILVRPFWKEAITSDGQNTKRLISVGDYKQHPNSVRLENGGIHKYTSPTDTPIEMGDLVAWLKTEMEVKQLHPIELAALLHYRFVCIHPFDDGNGRLSRLLLNYILLKNNYPPIIIKSDDKKRYLSALHQADTGHTQVFIDYIVDQLAWSLNLSIRAAKGESIDELGDFDKKIIALKSKFNYNDDVKFVKSTDAVSNCYKEAILPLFSTISSTLHKVSSFFREQSMLVELVSDRGIVTSLSGLAEATGRIETNGYYFREIIVTMFFAGLRSHTTEQLSFSVSITISFYQQVFQITSHDGNILIDKLYHEKFSDMEASEIAEKLGNSLIEQIEKSINK